MRHITVNISPMRLKLLLVNMIFSNRGLNDAFCLDMNDYLLNTANIVPNDHIMFQVDLQYGMDPPDVPVVKSQSVDLSSILEKPLSPVERSPSEIGDPNPEQNLSLLRAVFVASVPTIFQPPLEPPPPSIIGILSSRTLNSTITSRSDESISKRSLTYTTSEGPSEDEDENFASPNVSARSSTDSSLKGEHPASSAETTPRFFLLPRTPLNTDADMDPDASKDTAKETDERVSPVSPEISNQVKEPSPPSPSGLEDLQVVSTAVKEPISLLVPLALVSDPKPTLPEEPKSGEPEENKIGVSVNDVPRSKFVDISQLLLAKIPKEKPVDIVVVSSKSKSPMRRSLTSGKAGKVHSERSEDGPESSRSSKKKKDRHKSRSKSFNIKTVWPLEEDKVSLLSEVSALSKSPNSQTPPMSTSPKHLKNESFSPIPVNKATSTVESRIHTVNIQDKKSPPFLNPGSMAKVHPIVSDHMNLEPEITFVHRTSTTTSPPIPIQLIAKLDKPNTNADISLTSGGGNPQEATAPTVHRVLPFPGLQIEIPDPKEYMDDGISPLADTTTVVEPENHSKWGKLREKLNKELPTTENLSTAGSKGGSAWKSRRRSSTYSSGSHSSRTYRSSSSGSGGSRLNSTRRNSKYSATGKRGDRRRGKGEKAVIRFTMTDEQMAQVCEGFPYMRDRIRDNS